MKSHFFPTAIGLSFALFISSPVVAQDEGIAVHGDWEITLLDAEGEVIETHEFRNELRTEGQRALVELLTGTSKVGERTSGLGPAWGIIATAPLSEVNGDIPACNIIIGPFGSDPFSEDQAASLLPVAQNAQSFSLRRTISVPPNCVLGSSFSITRVSTRVGLENVNDQTTRARGFSEKILPTPITGILPDQSVVLNVTYSFE